MDLIKVPAEQGKPATRRHRYYAYQRAADGAVVWMTRQTHLMLLKYPTWLPRFHISKATGESRLLSPEAFLELRRGVSTPSKTGSKE